MFVDTSAVIAVLIGEPEADQLLHRLAETGVKRTAPHVRLESTMILAGRLGLEADDAERLFDDFLVEAEIDVIPITDAIGRKAAQAFFRFGKGRGHPAQLNFGDCLSYACASELDLPILFKGADFTHTDLVSA